MLILRASHGRSFASAHMYSPSPYFWKANVITDVVHACLVIRRRPVTFLSHIPFVILSPMLAEMWLFIERWFMPFDLQEGHQLGG